MKTRIQALALALLMCLTLLPVTTLAADSDFTIQNGILTRYRGPGGDVVIPASVTAIREGAFYECATLKSVIIPDSVTEIGQMAFQGCTSLVRVTMGSGVTAIHDQTFYGCTALADLTIGENVASIGRMAFEKCTSLTVLLLPQSVTYVDDAAFYGCTALVQVTIPESTVVADFAFDGCTSLPPNALPGRLPSREELVQTATQVGDFLLSGDILMEYVGHDGNVVVPDGVSYLYNGAFSNCADLTSVTIPASVVKLDKYVFSNCTSLKRVIFPAADKVAESLKYMMTRTLFYNCPALTELINCPDQDFNESLAANQALIASLGDPSTYIAPQSARLTALSSQICAGLSDDYQKAKAVYDWLTANIEYDYDYYEGRKATVITAPEAVLDSKLTVCDGYAQLTQALLRAQGIPALYVSGVSTITQEGHAWNVVFTEGRWICIDSTWGRQGQRDDNGVIISKVYTYDPTWFDPTEFTVALSHKADVPSGGASGHLNTVGNFTDVSATAYYADSVIWAVDKKITSGTSSTTFSPDVTCTTTQILTFLWRANGSPEPTIENPFSDVSDTDYYAKAALWAHEKELISGNAFAGATPCTRSMTVTYLWKLAGSPTMGASNFTDVPSGAEYSQAVAWAVDKKITSGTSATTFSPDATCTRGQIMTFLYRNFDK